MKTTENFYSVQITGLTGTPRLALGVQAGPALYYFRRDALRFKQGLVREGFRQPRVVKVRVTHTW